MIIFYFQNIPTIQQTRRFDNSTTSTSPTEVFSPDGLKPQTDGKISLRDESKYPTR